MNEFYCDNEYVFFNDEQNCPEVNATTTFFLLLSIVPISFLCTMIAVSQYMFITNDLVIEEEEKEIPYSKKYPIKKYCNKNKDPNVDLLSVLEYTPNGNVFMKYDLENESFDFWSDYKEIPFSHLETVARKYVNTFFCTDLYVREMKETSSDTESDDGYSSDFDEEEFTQNSSEESSSEEDDSNINEEKKEANASLSEDSDDDIFAKLKSTEKIKKVIKEDKPVNKFRYKGKLIDILEFKQQKSKKDEAKDVSFSSWKLF